jgi:hypothetical protein
MITLTRRHYFTTCIIGDISFENRTVRTLERPWRFNASYPYGIKGISCIPEGIYELEPHDTEAHPSTYALVNPERGVAHEPVAGHANYRTAVLIHPANFPSELRGCIAPGLSAQYETTTYPRLLQSRVAFMYLRDYINRLPPAQRRFEIISA